jgi:alkaline phosphatase D
MASGMKIGEVTSDSAIVWTRLTRFPSTDLETEWGSAATGAAGEVSVSYWPEGQEELEQETPWFPVVADKDYTRQLKLTNLLPATDYSVVARGRPLQNAEAVSDLDGEFRTAPAEGDASGVRFAVITCQSYHHRDDDENGFAVYRTMNSMDFDFFVHTGDIVYYDQAKPYATSVELARFKWNRMFALPFQRSFHNTTSSYFIKDDHDTLKNDAWPGQTYRDLTFAQGLEVFREQVPMADRTYRTIRWGKHLQIWLVEGRDFRSPNTMPDGPDKTIWGAEQKEWFFETVRASDATFRVLISPTPIIGPDRDDKADNHANLSFQTEGDELRSFIGSQQNMFVICGDRHWQYASEDSETGIFEFCSGPATDTLATKSPADTTHPMYRYVNLKGGFLSVDVSVDEEDPEITFTHHAVDGSIYHHESFRP